MDSIRHMEVQKPRERRGLHINQSQKKIILADFCGIDRNCLDSIIYIWIGAVIKQARFNITEIELCISFRTLPIFKPPQYFVLWGYKYKPESSPATMAVYSFGMALFHKSNCIYSQRMFFEFKRFVRPQVGICKKEHNNYAGQGNNTANIFS